jgi:hypothetical protein
MRLYAYQRYTVLVPRQPNNGEWAGSMARIMSPGDEVA